MVYFINSYFTNSVFTRTNVSMWACAACAATTYYILLQICVRLHCTTYSSTYGSLSTFLLYFFLCVNFLSTDCWIYSVFIAAIVTPYNTLLSFIILCVIERASDFRTQNTSWPEHTYYNTTCMCMISIVICLSIWCANGVWWSDDVFFFARGHLAFLASVDCRLPTAD